MGRWFSRAERRRRLRSHECGPMTLMEASSKLSMSDNKPGRRRRGGWGGEHPNGPGSEGGEGLNLV